ncbi:MAG TPA: NADPH-dependent FMN reductase [Baekduia sp.]|uniref:NADPH-dependent FMN reductase n=1 Tax=Baekduia sp. TaxID=2600305 RepID=UPI002D767789|nr:NADPH-dependent FMN reductase [Baekduia sp.]HET6509321.1 NADPH-dependent FMN reductase [Baekduia sp.]
MPTASPTLTVLLGSVTPPGRLHRAISTATERATARHAGSTIATFDLAELQIPFADGTPPAGDTARVVASVTDASAVLLATPVYRGSPTGALKNLLDHLPVPALRDTPVAIATMGAGDHHYLGADRHLRDILTFFGALTTPTSAYLTSRDFADGVPSDDALARLDALIDSLLRLTALASDGRAFGPPPIGAGRG